MCIQFYFKHTPHTQIEINFTFFSHSTKKIKKNKNNKKQMNFFHYFFNVLQARNYFIALLCINNVACYTQKKFSFLFFKCFCLLFFLWTMSSLYDAEKTIIIKAAKFSTNNINFLNRVNADEQNSKWSCALNIYFLIVKFSLIFPPTSLNISHSMFSTTMSDICAIQF